MNEDFTVQGSESWKNYRLDKIGGSESGVVMGLSPYKTPLQLYNEKKGITPPEEQNFAMQQGIDLEPIAREAYEKETGLPVLPTVLTHSELNYMLASLDGITFDNQIILEIKCGRTAFKQAKDGVIPDYYMAQLQHNMYVAGAKVAHYYCFNPDSQDVQNQIEAIFGEDNIKPEYETVLMTVERDEKFIELMLEAEEFFAECLKTNTPPPPTEKDVIEITDLDLSSDSLAVLKELESSYENIKAEEKRLSDLKKMAIKIADGRSIKYGKLQLRMSIRKGSIDYPKLIEKECPDCDVELYRKKSSCSWALSIKES